MRHSRAWKAAAYTLRVAVVCLTLIAGMFSTLVPAYAGTTGTISGTVTDKENGAPVAGVDIAAQAPTGTYRAVTDARGYYTMTGVYADTYAVAFSKTGYEPQKITGVTVNPDSSVPLSLQLQKSIKTIATVVARSQGTAYNPSQTTNTYTVNAAQIQNQLGSDINESESTLLTQLPGVGFDSSGFPVLHGGRENEEGFQFEGIPYTDAFTNQFVNSLALPGTGVASAQVNPGVGSASVASQGTGTINLVAQRGTYPGFTQFQAAAGGPNFNHTFITSMSYAAPNGHISDFATFNESNASNYFGNGTYTSQQLGTATASLYIPHSEFLNNLILRFGNNNREQVQLFADIGQTNFLGAYGGLNGYCFQTCNQLFTVPFAGIFGLTPDQVSSLSTLYPFQTSPNETLAQANRGVASQFQPNQAFKIGYTLNINPTTYLSFAAYSVNSVTTFDIPTGVGGLGTGDTYSLQGGHQLGSTLKLQKQFNEKHLVEVGVDYEWLHPVFQSNSVGLTWLSTLTDPTGGILGEPFDFLPNTATCQQELANFAAINFGLMAMPTAFTCGSALSVGGPTQLPIRDHNTTLNRRDLDPYIQDSIKFSDKVNANVGFRFENSGYLGLPAAQLLPDCTFEFQPASVANNAAFNPNNPLGANGNCPFIPNFSNINKSVTNPNVFEPRLGISWQLGKNTAVRATYERSAAMPLLGNIDKTENRAEFNAFNGLPSNLSFVPGTVGTNPMLALNSGSCGIFPFNVPCTSYGEQLYWGQQNASGTPYQPYAPMVANDYQVTLQHQFTKGLLNHVSFSVAPWLRHQYNTSAVTSQPILGPNGLPLVINGTQFSTGPLTNNLGKEFADGVDVNLVRDTTSGYGLSGQWTFTYINEFSSAIPGQVQEDFFPNIPFSSIQTGAVYRVGFISPFQTNLSLSYKTHSGWTINPRLHYNIGYPIGSGALTSDLINGQYLFVPNLDTLGASAAGQKGIGQTFFVDPANPGTVFAPNIIGQIGNTEHASPGGILTGPNLDMDLSLSYAPPQSRWKVGADIFNVFNRLYSQPFFSGTYQPLATGIGGPLSGQSANPISYQTPFLTNPITPAAFGASGPFNAVPFGIPINFDVYLSTKI